MLIYQGFRQALQSQYMNCALNVKKHSIWLKLALNLNLLLFKTHSAVVVAEIVHIFGVSSLVLSINISPHSSVSVVLNPEAPDHITESDLEMMFLLE